MNNTLSGVMVRQSAAVKLDGPEYEPRSDRSDLVARSRGERSAVLFVAFKSSQVKSSFIALDLRCIYTMNMYSHIAFG